MSLQPTHPPKHTSVRNRYTYSSFRSNDDTQSKSTSLRKHGTSLPMYIHVYIYAIRMSWISNVYGSC